MDPKQSSNPPLDPKLQEVYDRVMGTNLSGGVAPTGNPPTPAPSEPSQMPPAAPNEPPMPAAPIIDQPTPSAPTEPATPVVPPPMPPIPSLGDNPVTPQQPVQDNPMPGTTPVPNQPAMPATNPLTPPANPVPTMPTTPMPDPTPTADDGQGVNPSMPQPTPQPEVHQASPTPDAVSATISIPHHSDETIKIGVGGSPVAAAAKPKGKGISPVVLIFGAFAFLVVYAVFWVKFFGYSIPFLGK